MSNYQSGMAGFIPIIYYSGTITPVTLMNPLLTEASDDILAENSDYIEVETV